MRLELTRAAVRGNSTWKREYPWKSLSLLYGPLHSQPEPAWITSPAIIGSWDKYIIKHSVPNSPISTPLSGDWPGTGFLCAHVASTLRILDAYFDFSDMATVGLLMGKKDFWNYGSEGSCSTRTDSWGTHGREGGRQFQNLALAVEINQWMSFFEKQLMAKLRYWWRGKAWRKGCLEDMFWAGFWIVFWETPDTTHHRIITGRCLQA